MKNANLTDPTILVLADDLTSAADGAAPFLGRGLNVAVHRQKRNVTAKTSVEVLAVDCGSRSLNESGAAQVVGEVIKHLSDGVILLKTVDSTLRGNIKAELKAVYEASGRTRIVIAPAFPAAGRTTEKGIQLVDGVPVSETSYANDPVHPARTSRISELIPEEIETGEVKTVHILDANTQSELNEKVAAFPHPEEILWVGSPGMAIALATALFGDKIDRPEIPYAKNALVVVGSANAVSREQTQLLKDKDFITCLAMPEERAENADTILCELTSRAVELVKSGEYGAVIATGGDTMDALLQKLDIDEFSLVGEFEQGFPIGVARLGCGKDIVIAMKAGGFGAADTLLRAAEQLRLSKPNYWK
ncbi:hypothetical protein WH95_03055 [Kiloniella litopenaei]|uniref:Four-carbon acid sugar kinase family protein n=1 Tax=Kiloniella litopenaei TaxID=1549748 RepID=A0A0M2RCY0_9PROT|nr:four-carbon acid sugar kinase family protein [Kiloniella litopenaei]KKJ78299.1 hypothetical protein WH95_03055 [Kiloniella litopenaei]